MKKCLVVANKSCFYFRFAGFIYYKYNQMHDLTYSPFTCEIDPDMLDFHLIFKAFLLTQIIQIVML